MSMSPSLHDRNFFSRARHVVRRGIFPAIIALVTAHAFAIGTPAAVETYAFPSIYQKSRFFSLKANGKDVPVTSYSPDYDYAQLSISPGTCQLEITSKTQARIEAYTVTPMKLNLPAKVSGNHLTVTLEKSEYLIVWIKGVRQLVISADAKETNKPPASGPGIYNVRTQYQASNTGSALASPAIQKAIDDAARQHADGNGMGLVYVPSGVYKIGNLELKSNVALYLEGGAVLVGSGQPADFKKLFRKKSMNRDGSWLVYTADGAKNVKIFGRGTIDGAGYETAHKQKFLITVLMVMGCQNFEVDGILMRDSGMWGNIVARSNGVLIQNYKILNRLDTGENDGLDVCESRNVLVKNCLGIALDDPFSTKTWEQSTDICTNWYGSAQKLQDVTFDGCTAWTRCYAFKVGQGVVQDQEKVTFKNGVVHDCAVGIGIHHKWGAGSVKDVTFSNIDIESVHQGNPQEFDLQGVHVKENARVWAWFVIQGADKRGGGPVSNLTVENIRVRDAGQSPARVQGLSEQSKFSNVRFSNILMPGSEQPAKTLEEIGVAGTPFSENVRIE